MISEIAAILAEDNLLEIHPNNAAKNDFVIPDSFIPWWNNPPDWENLLNINQPPQLARNPIKIPITIPQSTHHVSVKKHHEVSRMTQFIANLLNSRFPHLDPSRIHIVDIGAGQAYLTRALHALFNAPTLALDSDHAQTKGAQARDPSNGITHKTIHITPTTLINAIDDWIPSTPTPVQVLLVALHACGSLTPDILRAFLSVLQNPTNHPTWTPISVVAVGCCYNLMSIPADFPLSSSLLSANPPLHLPKSAFQLASQVPSHWNDSPASLAAASLAIRKVVWRALLTRFSRPDLDTKPDSNIGTGSSPAVRRLGRLNDSVYSSWDTFLKIAGERLGLETNFNSLVGAAFEDERGGATGISDYNSSDPEPRHDFNTSFPESSRGRDALLERRLEVLHVLRCQLGPVVESLIVLDRVEWVKEMLNGIGILVGGDADGDGGADEDGDEERDANRRMSTRMQVEIVNLFDQAAGSGRNIAIVVAPPPPLPIPELACSPV
jgi:hypothetical protein